MKDLGNTTEPSLCKPPPRDTLGCLYDSVRGTENAIGLSHASNRLAFGEQFVVYDTAQAYPHFLLTIRLGPQTNPLDLLRPGHYVALYAVYHRKFLSMRGEDLGYSLVGLDEPCSADAAPLRPDKTWERFLVVDAGDSHIALYNPCHGRFLRMIAPNWQVDGGGGPTGPNALPAFDQWPSERWDPVAAGHGKAALYSPACRRFLRIAGGGGADGGGGECPHELPDDWECERLIVLPHPLP